MLQKTIFLVGMRASGKTSFGKVLAQKLQWDFVDSDVYVQEKSHCSIAHMVATQGWEFFRQAESAALQEIFKEKTVIATGGGMVLKAENREFMRKNGVVCFLSVPTPVLCARLMADPNTEQRPALSNLDFAQEIQQTLEKRLSLYESTAHFTLDGNQPVEQLLESFCSKFNTIG